MNLERVDPITDEYWGAAAFVNGARHCGCMTVLVDVWMYSGSRKRVDGYPGSTAPFHAHRIRHRCQDLPYEAFNTTRQLSCEAWPWTTTRPLLGDGNVSAMMSSDDVYLL